MSAIFGNLLGKQHLGTLFLIILFAMKLWNKKAFQGMETKFFWLPLISCLILTFQDVLEAAAAQDPAMRFWRTLLSVVGYNFRSVAAVGMLRSLLLSVIDPMEYHLEGNGKTRSGKMDCHDLCRLLYGGYHGGCCRWRRSSHGSDHDQHCFLLYHSLFAR